MARLRPLSVNVVTVAITITVTLYAVANVITAFGRGEVFAPIGGGGMTRGIGWDLEPIGRVDDPLGFWIILLVGIAAAAAMNVMLWRGLRRRR